MVDKGVRFGGSTKRLSIRGEHTDYLASTNDANSPRFIKKIAAGPIESDDGKYMIGSLFIVEATREEAEAFNANDPFKIKGVWETVSDKLFLLFFSYKFNSQVTINRWVSLSGIKEVTAEVENNDITTIKMVVK